MTTLSELKSLINKHILVEVFKYNKQDMEWIRCNYPKGKNNVMASMVFENEKEYSLEVCILDEEKKLDSFSFIAFCCTCCNKVGVYDDDICTLTDHIMECVNFFDKIPWENLDFLNMIIDRHDEMIRQYKALRYADLASKSLHLLNKAKESKAKLVEEFEKNQLSNFTESVSSSAAIEKEKYSDTNSLCDVFLTISNVVSNPKDFPPLPGIYLLRCFVDNKWQSLYLGLSNDIRNRWKQHHRQKEVNALTRLGIKIEYRYLVDSPLTKLSEPLEIMEAKLIKAFNPKLNREYVEA